MKPNPANFEPWKDPNGGEWIRMKNGIFKDVTWRPVDMKMEEDNPDGSANMSFTCEFFGEVPERYATFEKTATAIVMTILQEMMEAHNEQ